MATAEATLLTDRADWRAVRVADVVENVNVHEREPLENGLTRYVGLEHLSSDTLRIGSWGDITEGTSFTKKFVAGQVLFPKRRVYQRKLAYADFEGLCSGDILVLQPRNDKLIPELLPFLVQTQSFVAHALDTSAGSLSPRTRWRDLASYQFALPPKPTQHRIATLLLQVEDARTRLTALLKRASRARLAWLHRRMGVEGTDFKSGWTTKMLGELAAVDRGKFTHRPRNEPRLYGGPYPFAQTGDIAGAEGFLTEASQTLSDEGREVSRSFPAGTILMSIAAVIGATAITTFETWCPDSVVGIIPKPGTVDVQFLEAYLSILRPQLEGRYSTKSTQSNTNLRTLRGLLIPVPPSEEQAAIIDSLAATHKGLSAIRTSRLSLSALLQVAVNALLSHVPQSRERTLRRPDGGRTHYV